MRVPGSQKPAKCSNVNWDLTKRATRTVQPATLALLPDTRGGGRGWELHRPGYLPCLPEPAFISNERRTAGRFFDVTAAFRKFRLNLNEPVDAQEPSRTGNERKYLHFTELFTVFFVVPKLLPRVGTARGRGLLTSSQWEREQPPPRAPLAECKQREHVGPLSDSWGRMCSDVSWFYLIHLILHCDT